MSKKTSLLVDRHIINNKVVVELANFLYRMEGLSQSRAFFQAHKTIELLEKLNKGCVEFDFYYDTRDWYLTHFEYLKLFPLFLCRFKIIAYLCNRNI